MPLKILIRVGDNNYKFQPFQEDLGAPLVQDDVVIGILARIQEKLQQSVIFVDLYKSSKQIDSMINDRVKLYKDILPRKKARYDCITFRKRRARKSTLEETIHEETNHEEINYEETDHEKNNHKRKN